MSETEDGRTEPGGLELLADGTRRAILLELASVRGTADESMGFERLRRRVGCADSGTFNYHLDQLRNRFVRRSNGGYQLTASGSVAVGSLAGGAFEHAEDPDALELDDDCPRCGSDRTAAFDGRTLVVGCSNGHVHQSTEPFGRLRDRSIADVLEVASRNALHRLEHLRSGVCARCYARVEGRVRVDEEAAVTYAYEALCTECGGHTVAALGTCVARHPAVVSFFHDRGVDVRDRHVWQLGFAVDAAVSELSTDDRRFQIDVACNGDRLELVLDERALVKSTTLVTD